MCSRDILEFEPTHGVRQQATLAVDAPLGAGRNTLTSSVWADSALYMSTGAENE